MGRKLSRVQKAGALIPMAVLVGGWAVAVGNTGLASAIVSSDNGIPEVPATAMDQPSVARAASTSLGSLGALDPQAGLSGALATLSTNGIPTAALYAYHHAESVLADADPSCHLSWNLLAGIGRVETNHGRSDGNALNSDGIAQPGISGPNMGPMQLSAATFKAVAIDADTDGQKNPQDIDDAATAAGIFLCSGQGDLSTDSGARSAVKRYGGEASFVDSVMQFSTAYANGQYSQTPDGYSTSTILTSASLDQTLTSEEREENKKHEEDTVKQREEDKKRDEERSRQRARNIAKNNNGGGDSNNNGGGNDGDGGGNGGGGGHNDPVGDTVKGVTDTVNKTLKDTGDTVNKTLKDTGDAVNKLLGGKKN